MVISRGETRGLAAPRKRRRGRGIFLFGQLALLCLVAAFLFLHAPFFRLADIKITGNSVVGSAELTHRAGLRLGDNILAVKLRLVEERVKRHPYIEDAKASRRFPSTIVIAVTERRPLAAVAYFDAFLVVDREGRVLQVAGSDALTRYPAVTGVRVKGILAPGDYLEAPGYQAGAACLEKLGPDVAGMVSEVNVAQDNEVTLVLRDGVPVYLGALDSGLAGRLALLGPILADVNASHLDLAYIDLRYAGRPVVMPKTGGK